MSERGMIGGIEWRDLTVENAESVSEFYASVIGWKRDAVPMDGYDDFNMVAPASGEPIAGVCHAAGGNQGLPAQWMMYVRVADVGLSVQSVIELGGQVLKGPTEYGGDTYYVIQDPAGAVLTVFSKTS